METGCKGSNDLNQRSATYGPEAKSGPLPVLVNKGLLEHSHAHLYTHVCGCFCTLHSVVTADTVWIPKHEILIIWSFKKKLGIHQSKHLPQ